MSYINKFSRSERYTKLSTTKPLVSAQFEDHYSLLLSDNNGNTVLCVTPRVRRLDNKSQVASSNASKAITPNICVDVSREVLGLKVNEIAKIIGISRATLDLHRKGADFKERESNRYMQLHNFATNVQTLYGTSLKKGMRNILINKKTLVQHMIINADNLDKVFKLVDKASESVGALKVDNETLDPMKLQSRLIGIGKLA
ncbi:hypothetical protein ABMX80_15970 [Vibrio vulnificus]|uniref:hypothetical protein n=1 Tax=Vibrio vulnificus TaxID=672 RepID=UPI003ED97820